MELDRVDGRQVVGARALVVEGHGAVALEVRRLVARPRGVDWQLLVVDPDAVPVRIRIRKESALQHGIGAGLDAWWQVRWVEGYMLSLGKVVDGILVEGEVADLGQRELLLRPDVGEVEDVDLLLLPQLLGFLGVIVCTSTDHLG